MKKEILKQVIKDFQNAELPRLFHRHLDIPFDTGKIITITGARRSGKTYFLFQSIEKLLARGCNKNRIIYINFEDERFDFTSDELDLILQAYIELYPTVDLKDVHFFFDEIQNIDKWDLFVRRIHDSISKHIYITGSNSKLLSKEISTSLRGRALPFEMYPLNFKEYLEFNQVDTDYHSTKNRGTIRHYLERFQQYGGFPEVLFLDDSLKDKTLQEYFNTMLFRDLVERYEIKQVHVLKYFLKRLFASITKSVSTNKIYNELKSQGIKISKNILYDFMESVENIYMVIVLKKYEAAVVKQELAEKKVYAVDNGLINAVTYHFSEDKGKLLENLIAVELMKCGRKIYFYKNAGECDFIWIDKDKILMAIQVCLTLKTPGTFQREIRGLVLACEKYGLKKGYIVTDDEEEVFTEKGIEINLVPAFKFLLELSIP